MSLADYEKTHCVALLNTHLAMGWTMCGKPAVRLATKQGRDFALCRQHAAQHQHLPQRPVEASTRSAEKQAVPAASPLSEPTNE